MVKTILIIAAVIYVFVTFIAPIPKDIQAKQAYGLTSNKVIPITAQAQTNITQIIGNKLKEANPAQYLGQSIKTSSIGLVDNQTLDCVDLFNVDLFNRTGIKPKIKVGGAKQIWNNPSLEIDQSIKFEKILNSPDFVPKKGDYLVWTTYPESDNPKFKSKDGAGNVLAGDSDYGHVAIDSGESTSNMLIDYEQDTFANVPTYKAERSYHNLAGVIRLISIN